MGNCCCREAKVADESTEIELEHEQRSKTPGSDGSSPQAPRPKPSAVKVAVVVRPLQPAEAAAGAREIVTVEPPSRVAVPQRAPALGSGNGSGSGASGSGGEMAFTFDRVLRASGPAAGAALFDEHVAPVVDKFVAGYNGTVLAYGQTGSGKTYTMGMAAGASGAGGGGANSGIVPRAIARVFEHVARVADAYESQLTATYVEIYQEQVRDLLASLPLPPLPPSGGGSGGGDADGGGSSSAGGSFSSASGSGGGGGGGAGGVTIRETADGQIILDGATEAAAATPGALAAIVARGNERRATGAHNLNDASSRSHAVLTLTLTQRARSGAAAAAAANGAAANGAAARGAPDPRAALVLRSKLALVDLAGSERAKATGAAGARFAEGCAINSGLLALGNVINALADREAAAAAARGQKEQQQQQRRHVPYRDSKLTRLLQDGLGGNSETLFVACVSPASTSHEHTLGTLRYAARAATISNQITVNNAMTAAEEVAYLRSKLRAANAEAAALREEVAALKAALLAAAGGR